MVRVMSIEELEGLIRRRYRISKSVRLVRVEIMDYLVVFEFSNSRVVLVAFDDFDAKKKLFVFRERPLTAAVVTKRLSRGN
ncbi:MAG: hypothetical protein L7H10_07685 [Vulcanisaeta sp.]|jgi:hypothetical protein|nr:hypothetical protein [Vulcanisaeta sp.]